MFSTSFPPITKKIELTQAVHTSFFSTASLIILITDSTLAPPLVKTLKVFPLLERSLLSSSRVSELPKTKVSAQSLCVMFIWERGATRLGELTGLTWLIVLLCGEGGVGVLVLRGNTLSSVEFDAGVGELGGIFSRRNVKLSLAPHSSLTLPRPLTTLW